MRPTWDETWLQVAAIAAQRAACNRSQVGCVLVKDNLYSWMGYNGTPSGEIHCSDGGCPRGMLTYDQVAAGTAYDNCKGLHAEMNAVIRAGTEARGGTIYITREPCDWCYKILKSAGIVRAVWPEGELTL